jgi:hypothetical protein
LGQLTETLTGHFGAVNRPSWERFLSGPGLPDFSWYNLPKRVKMYQNRGNMPNGMKIDQTDIKYANIFHY